MEEKKELEFNRDLNPSDPHERMLCDLSADKARSNSKKYSYFYDAMNRINYASGHGLRSIEFEERLTTADVDRIEAMGYTISSKENLDETTNIYETVKITW